MLKNKLTSILLSVTIAFGLWLYVVTTVSQEDDYTFPNIPVVMEGESVLNEQGLMITYKSTEDIDLRLSGNRSDLSKVNSNNITVKADLSKIDEAGEHALPLTPSFPGDVASNALTVEERNPTHLYVTVEERRNNKEVPVEVKWVGSVPEGFMSDRENRVLDNSVVLISGPASAADLIEKAVIEVDLSEQRKSISQNYRYTLCDAEGNAVDAELIVTNVAEIHLDVTIHQVKEVPLQLDITYGGGATDENTIITIDPLTIRLSGGEAVLEELGDVITLGKIDLSLIDKSQLLTFPINLPEGVTNLSNITEASVAVRFSGLSTREFTVDTIHIVNVPEGMNADLITEKLEIVVRGPSAEISKIRENNIVATVDFTGAEVGTSTFKVTFGFGEGFETVGAVGTYSVSATVQQQ